MLLHTKLTPPPLRPSLVPRPQLAQKLQQALAFPLTLVSAPAGFGKTTAVAAALPRLAADAALAWLSLDAQDNEASRFWRYFFAAVETAVPRQPSLAASLDTPQPPPIQPLLTRLINQLAAQTTPLLCVLDDAHLLDQPDLWQTVGFLLDHAPPTLHLLLLTRADPPLPLHRLRARGRLLEIRADDLRFNAAETAVFLQNSAAVALPETAVAQLHAQTEGWAVGLQLAALAMPPDPPHQADFLQRLTANNRYILEYLTEEVLAQQPPHVQTFLQQTAVLQQLSGPLCDAVTETHGSDQLLADLAQRNLFVLPLSETPIGETAVPWYRYHHLFAALLQGHLRQRQPDAAPMLHQRAARWFAAHGDVETALDHALHAQDFTLSAQLLEENAGDFLMQGRARLLETWLHRLPPDQLAALPRANVAFARALLLRGRYADIQPYLTRAAATDLAAADPAFQGEIQVLRATLADTQGHAAAAMQFAQQALAVIPEEHLLSRAMAQFALAGAHREAGDTTAATVAYEAALPLCRAARLPLLALLVRAHLCFLHQLRGRLHLAAAAAAPGAAPGISHPAAAAAYVSLGSVYAEWNRLDEAAALLQEAQALVGESGHNAVAVQGQLVRARLRQAHGDAAGVQQALAEADAWFARGAPPWLEPLLREQQVQFWLAQEDAAMAARVLAQMRDTAVPLHMRDFLTLAQARIALHRKQALLARRLLDGVVETAVAHERNGVLLTALLLRTLAAAVVDDAAAARADVRRALALAQPEGYVRVFVELGAPLASLLAQANHPYARELLAHFPPGVETAVSPLPDPLTEREMDVLRLMADGLTYQQIADALVVSVNTVRHHVKGLYSKLAVSSRAQAVARARELGLLGEQ